MFYSLPVTDLSSGETLRVSVDITNTGKLPADEVVQLYLRDLEAMVRVPRWQLVGLRRIQLNGGEKQSVSFEVLPQQMALIDEEEKRILEPGVFRVYVGGQQPG